MSYSRSEKNIWHDGQFQIAVKMVFEMKKILSEMTDRMEYRYSTSAVSNLIRQWDDSMKELEDKYRKGDGHSEARHDTQ